MEAALRTCCKGIKIGKILVVRHHGQMSSRAGTSVPGSSPSTTLPTPNQASAEAAVAAAAGAGEGPFNSPRRSQQWREFNAATEAYRSGTSSSSQPGSQAPSRPLSGSSAPRAAAAADGGTSNGNNGCSSSSIAPRPPAIGVSPKGSPYAPGAYSTEGSAFAAALATYGNAAGQCWIQHNTQAVIYEKLPADIAERHVLLMDPVLSTGNSAYTAIEVGESVQ